MQGKLGGIEDLEGEGVWGAFTKVLVMSAEERS